MGAVVFDNIRRPCGRYEGVSEIWWRGKLLKRVYTVRGSRCALISRMLSRTNAVAPGAVCERNTGGKAVFEVEGVTFEAAAQPFRFYVLKRVQDEYDALTGANRDSVDALLTRCKLRDVLDIRLTRDIGRANNLEVWT